MTETPQTPENAQTPAGQSADPATAESVFSPERDSPTLADLPAPLDPAPEPPLAAAPPPPPPPPPPAPAAPQPYGAAAGDRPEVALGAAFAGGFLLAMILRRLAR